ncbi:toll-like receptor 4 [Gigantopelta aegis]|uniref:toll-like receptor 4 n=1 Tax=Gigantopelta aegis TaxID=1735272 RepID=UPI001B88921E|nr:toll-like receptor 4 [Gigantopelta aegis]
MASLKELSFRNGYCHLQNLFNKTFVNIKQVSHLDLSNCAMEHIAAGAFLPLSDSLTHLDISYNRKLRFDQVGIGAFGWQNSRLHVLNISGIEAKYAICVKITKEHLKHYTNTSIVEIYADENRIETFEKGALQLLPSSLKKVSLQSERLASGLYMLDLHSLVGLEEMDIGGQKEIHISSKWEPRNLITKTDCLADDEPLCSEFAENQYKNNLRQVDFSHNLISTWIGPIEGLQKLKILDLSNNLATHAEQSFFRNFNSLLFLNISWNLLSNVISQDRDGVLKSLKDSCTSNFGLKSGISAIVILVLIIFLGGFAYRYRWKLRYWYYGARYNYKHINSYEALGNYQYDAFVSYAPEDEQFFRIEMLSNTHGKILVNRDAISPSEHPLNKTGNLIEQSRKTVLLLSEYFLEDEMCIPELQAALPEHLNTKRDLILMILLEGMPREKIPDEIKYLLQTDSYIEYHEDNKETFWQRFNKAISPREVT